MVKVAGKVLLLDIGPDFRQQALKYRLDQVDGLLLTHTHYDHIAGIDELRVMNFHQKKPFPCLMSRESLEDLKRRYFYLFQPAKEGETRSTQLDCQILPKDSGEIDFLEIKIRYMSYYQGNMKVNGFRIGNFAYVTDIRRYEEGIFNELEGIETLVLSALRIEPSHVHFSLDEAAAFAHRIGAKKTWLTHLSHSVEYDDAIRVLPPDVKPGFDGLELSFGDL